MSDEELVTFASEFRKGIISTGTSSRGFCGMVCWPLTTLLNLHGVECQEIEVDTGDCRHVFIRLADGRVLDPTADQFNYFSGIDLPPVYLGPALPIIHS